MNKPTWKSRYIALGLAVAAFALSRVFFSWTWGLGAVVAVVVFMAAWLWSGLAHYQDGHKKTGISLMVAWLFYVPYLWTKYPERLAGVYE